MIALRTFGREIDIEFPALEHFLTTAYSRSRSENVT